MIRGNALYTTAAPDPQFSGNLVGTYRLPRGSLRGRIFQNYTATKSGGNQARVTGASVGARARPQHRLAAELRLRPRPPGGRGRDRRTPAREDIDRMTATAVYSYDLTEVVSADIGYRFRSRTEDPTDAQSNAVFFQIGRTFETIP